VTTAAQPGTWTLDTTASSAEFAARNLLVKTVRGFFPIRTATVSTDEDGRPHTLHAVLAADGFSTDNTVRNSHIKGKRILNTTTYPDLTFTSTNIAETGTNTWLIDGELTVRDHTTPLTLQATIRTLDPDHAHITATATLQRDAAGISAPTFVVGKEITIEVTAVLRPTR
jgi:polyisoprenoid-binding protein YceI